MLHDLGATLRRPPAVAPSTKTTSTTKKDVVPNELANRSDKGERLTWTGQAPGTMLSTLWYGKMDFNHTGSGTVTTCRAILRLHRTRIASDTVTTILNQRRSDADREPSLHMPSS